MRRRPLGSAGASPNKSFHGKLAVGAHQEFVEPPKLNSRTSSEFATGIVLSV